MDPPAEPNVLGGVAEVAQCEWNAMMPVTSVDASAAAAVLPRPPPPSAFELIAQSLALVQAFKAMEKRADESAQKFIAAAGETIVASPLAYAAGVVVGLITEIVHIVVDTLVFLVRALLWLAVTAGCMNADVFAGTLLSRSADSSVAGVSLCEPYLSAKDAVFRVLDGWDTLKQELDDLDAALFRLMGVVLVDLLGVVEILSKLIEGELGEKLDAAAHDADELGQLSGAILANVILAVAPAAELGLVAKVGARLEGARALVAGTRIAEVTRTVWTEADVARVLAALREAGVTFHPRITAAEVEAVRTSTAITGELRAGFMTLRSANAKLSRSLLYTTGSYDGLTVVGNYNAEAKLALLLELSEDQVALNAAEQLRATAVLSERVFEKAHVIDFRVLETGYWDEGFDVLGQASKGDMRAIVVLASDHTRSPYAYFDKLLGWRPEAEDIGGNATRITDVFFRRIKLLKPGKAPEPVEKGVFQFGASWKLSEVFEAFRTVWKEEFPVVSAKVDALLAADIATLKAAGL